MIQKSVDYLSEPPVEFEEEKNEFARLEGTWIGPEKQELTLEREDLLWNVFRLEP